MSFILLDLDSTLFNIDERLPHVIGKVKNWKKFRENIYLIDREYKAIVDIIRGLQRQGYVVIVLTGRSRVHEATTILQLKEAGIKFVRLIMRNKNDWSSSYDFKKKKLLEIFPTPIAMAFDDHPEVVKLYREYGIPTFQPHLSKYKHDEHKDCGGGACVSCGKITSKSYVIDPHGGVEFMCDLCTNKSLEEVSET